MIKSAKKFTLFMLFVVLPTYGHAADGVSLGEMAQLQATMQQFVDHKTVDGRYLVFDSRRAEVRELYPVTGHPMVLQFEDHFVLCFDFVDAENQKVEIDYYLARRGGGFVVFHEAVANRGVLEAMMGKGRVSAIK